MYVLERARRMPDWEFMAIEMRAKHVRHIQTRARALGLENLVVVHGDARRLVPEMGPDDRFDRVSIHFPDPWWKKRHRKRAVLTEATLDHLVRLLSPGGELYVQTDVFSRAGHMLRTLSDREDLLNASPGGGLHAGPVSDCPSNRERICMDRGLPVFRMLFKRGD
jgi:tRNA (guanine-N7-)-methyltransferase